MAQRTFLDYDGLQRFLNNLKTIIPTKTSDITNDSGFLTSASSLDSSKLTGTIDIARLPKGALERLVTVANQTARFALTTSDVQLGDTVKQLDTGVMYIVTDETKLSSADGYTEYTAGSATSVPWSGVTGKPSSFTPSSHTHGNVTNDGKLPTASRALISDSSKNITVSSVSDTELGYLSGVTSAIQTQLNGKATDSGVVHLTGTESISGDKTFITGLNISNDDTSQSTPQIYLRNYKNSRSSTTLTGTQSINFNDKDNNGLGYLAFKVTSLGNTVFDLATLQTGDNNSTIYGGLSYIARTTSNDSFIPSKNNLVDLGSSSYKWNKIYSDDVVHTSGNESVSGTKSFNSDLNLNYASTDVDDIVNSVAGSATLDNFVHMTGNETVNGIKSFPDGVIANVTGSATSATNDGSGNVISTTYGKLGANNTWSGLNSYNQSIQITANFNIGAAPSSDVYGGFNFGNGTSNIGNVTARVSSAGTTYSRLYIGNKFTDGALDPNGTWKYAELRVGLRANGDRFIYTDCLWRSDLTPYDSNLNLGNSTNKWKTLNGINPGALSLATTDTSKINYFNGDITDKTGGANNKTFAVDGWITVIIPNVSGDFIAIDNSIGQTVSISGTGVGHSSIDISCPVRAGVQVTILCKCSGGSVLAAHTWCEGNV